MTLDRYQRPSNGCQGASGVMAAGLARTDARRVRHAGQLRRGLMKRISMYLICKRAWRRPRSTQTHPPTRNASHPHLEALPRPPTTSGPRFQPGPGCWQARTAQLSHLAHNS